MSSPAQTRASMRAANTASSRSAARSQNACERCRKQKIRCSGSQPCDACRKRKSSCHFDKEKQRVVVTKGFIRNLERRASEGVKRRPILDHGKYKETAENTTSSYPNNGSAYNNHSSAKVPKLIRLRDQALSHTENSDDGDEADLINLLSQRSSRFMTASNGQTYYLGASSNWTFTQRVLSMIYDSAFQNQVPNVERFIGGLGNAYELPWDGIPLGDNPSLPTIPTIDHAIYLINAVKFHCTQLLHLFDENTFMPVLYSFYDTSPDERYQTDCLWQVHFMLLLAFGKAMTVCKRSKDPPGVEYFIKAMQMLPSSIMLWRHPIHAIEILTCIALYLQCLDYRILAHNYMGQALRLALNYGLHTDFQPDVFQNMSAERISRAWWTICILDSEMSSIAGLPQSVHHNGIHCRLPTFSGSAQRVMVFKMQLRLSDLMASITQNVYGVGGKLHRDFQKGIERALGEIAELHEELYRCFHVPEDEAQEGVSRTSAHLYLTYYRCIVLATRPMLFCFIKIRLESHDDCHNRLNSSSTARSMIQMCLDASIQILITLDLLLDQNLLESFLPFDLDSVSAATINILVIMALDHGFIEKGCPWISTADNIFNDLVASGNQVAAVRVKELDQLKSLLARLDVDDQQQGQSNSQTPTTSTSWATARESMSSFDLMPSHYRSVAEVAESTPLIRQMPIQPTVSLVQHTSQPLDSSAITGFRFDAETSDPSRVVEIMDLANAMAQIDSSWVTHIIGHDSIW